MTADPPVRPDKLCANGCGKRLIAVPPKSMPKHMRAAFTAELAREPFCSASCCREWHGNPDRENPQTDPFLTRAPAKFYGSDERRAYREKHKVPCEGGCGTRVEGRGRTRGKNPDRPYLCINCWRARQRERKAAA